MEVKKLVYATDLREPTYDIFESLLAIKKTGLERIILLSETAPEGLRRRLSNDGVDLRTVEESKPLPSKILETADREHASLVVTRLNREKKRLFRGDAVRELIRNTRYPLLLIQENAAGKRFSTRGLFDSVLLATNWSDSANKAFLYIIGLKEIVGLLDIVYVMNEKPTVKDIRQLKERIEELRRICLEEQIDAESHIYAGKTAAEIVLASKDYDATLIVMGYNAKGPVQEIFSGSACFRVAEKSSVPVLIIP
jgi:nucleotide-binding universal stress UspA family protein